MDKDAPYRFRTMKCAEPIIEVKADTVVLVIDLSGSMNSYKVPELDKLRVDACREQLLATLGKIDERAQVAIIAYSSGVLHWIKDDPTKYGAGVPELCTFNREAEESAIAWVEEMLDPDACAKEVEASTGRRALSAACHVGDWDALGELVETVRKEFGRIDVLVNNAGGTGPRAALETSENYFERALRMNVTQAFLLSKLAIPVMVNSAGAGAIVNISSRASDMVQTSFAAYGAGKAALNMMTRNVALEWAPKVRVNAISVGGVETEGLAVVLTNDALRKQFEDNTPMRRPGDVEDIACMALYLAADASSWVTGKIFQVDGGVEAPAMSVPVEPL